MTKMPGMKEVAELARVSTATVSRVLSEDSRISAATRSRVMAAAKELGYIKSFAASGLASGQNWNVGVILPSVNGWYLSSVLEGIADSLLTRGYDLTLYNSAGGTHQRILFDDFLLRQRVDGVVIIGTRLERNEATRLHAVRRPIVSVGDISPHAGVIQIHNARAATAATSYLISLGHQRIAYVGGVHDGSPLDDGVSLPLGGFETAMQQGKLPLNKKWLVRADLTVGGGRRAAMELLNVPREDRPSAIVGSSDEVAIGVLLAARELNLSVPGQLSVIGIDGNELGETFGLTTVDQFAHEQGRIAVSQLLMQLASPNGSSARSHLTCKTELVIRSSTGFPTIGGY